MFKITKAKLFVLSAMVGLFPAVATAQTNFNVDNGAYDVADNWDNGLPGAGNDAFIANGGTATVAEAGYDHVGYTLTISNGTLDMQGKWKMDDAQIVQNGGTVNGSEPAGSVFVGWDGETPSTYTLNNGQLQTSSGNLHLGRFAEGIFYQDGGTVTVGGSLNIGPTFLGSYHLSAGTVQTEDLRIDYENENGANGSTFNFTTDSTGVLYVNTSGVIDGGIPSEGTVHTIPELITEGHMTLGGSATGPHQFTITELTTGPFAGYTEVSASSTGKLGDFNSDTVVDLQDFSRLRDNMNAHLDREVGYEDGDIDFDGDIDLDDFGQWKEIYLHLSQTSSAIGVPEPSSVALSLWALAGIALQVRHRGHRTR